MPHIHNLRKRAQALGLLIKRTTDTTEARIFGHHLYAVHEPQQVWQDVCDVSLYGVELIIKEEEHIERVKDG